MPDMGRCPLVPTGQFPRGIFGQKKQGFFNHIWVIWACGTGSGADDRAKRRPLTHIALGWGLTVIFFWLEIPRGRPQAGGSAPKIKECNAPQARTCFK